MNNRESYIASIESGSLTDSIRLRLEPHINLWLYPEPDGLVRIEFEISIREKTKSPLRNLYQAHLSKGPPN